MKWIAVRSPVSTWLWPTLDLLAMARYDKSCTTTLRGQPRQRCLVITNPPMTCRTASASHVGHGMDSSRKPRLERCRHSRKQSIMGVGNVSAAFLKAAPLRHT